MHIDQKGLPKRYFNEEWAFVAPYMALIGTTEHGIWLEVVKHFEANRGFAMLQQR